LEQIILLLSNLLYVILAHPFNQGRGLLLSLDGAPTGVRLPDSKIGHLLGGRGEFGYPLTSGGKLRGQLPAQSCLLDKTVPDVPLTMKKQGLLAAALHEGLQRRHELEAHEGRMEHGSMNRSYLTDWGNDVMQRVQRGHQRVDRKSDPRLDGAPVFRLLLVI
jgi:hypothetical protein